MTRNRWQVFPIGLFVILVVAYCSILARAQSKPAQNATAAKSAKSDSAVPDDISDTEVMDAHDPRVGIPPMPKGKVSLIGGTVQKVDPIRQRLTIAVFGNHKRLTFGYDERSHLYRDGAPATYKALQKGELVYVDSMLARDNKLFARNVRVVTSLKPADARGQITQYQPRTGILVLQDELSQSPVSLHVGNDTKVTGTGASSRQDLVPGSLVEVRFNSNHRNGASASEITVLAKPGNTFTFAGNVTHLDMVDGIIAVHNQSDDKTYELRFDPGTVTDDVTVGTNVTVSAEFQGNQYKARRVKVNSSANSESSSM